MVNLMLYIFVSGQFAVADEPRPTTPLTAEQSMAVVELTEGIQDWQAALNDRLLGASDPSSPREYQLYQEISGCEVVTEQTLVTIEGEHCPIRFQRQKVVTDLGENGAGYPVQQIDVEETLVVYKAELATLAGIRHFTTRKSTRVEELESTPAVGHTSVVSGEYVTDESETVTTGGYQNYYLNTENQDRTYDYDRWFGFPGFAVRYQMRALVGDDSMVKRAEATLNAAPTTLENLRWLFTDYLIDIRGL